MNSLCFVFGIDMVSAYIQPQIYVQNNAILCNSVFLPIVEYLSRFTFQKKRLKITKKTAYSVWNKPYFFDNFSITPFCPKLLSGVFDVCLSSLSFALCDRLQVWQYAVIARLYPIYFSAVAVVFNFNFFKFFPYHSLII